MKYKQKRKDLTLRQRRHRSLRNKVQGTPERPRLNVLCTLKYVYAQVIDDTTGRVLASANSSGKNFPLESRANIAAAKVVGKLVAEAAVAANVKTVVFDRSGYMYHGKVKALADAAREAGLLF
jgi:large subunit ribosomal protein L18